LNKGFFLIRYNNDTSLDAGFTAPTKAETYEINQRFGN